MLLSRLEAAWWEQGANAFQMGLGTEDHLERSAASGLSAGPGSGHAPGGAGMSTNWNGEEKQPGDGCGLVVLLVFVPAIAAMLEVLQWLA
ncbi:MAG: hypothetical protein KatS3mg051_1028 [Anaerolineae bacterium]|nr:MAG: hypothetical protein KatS3mg051_1028 [Anaerolineae bacterium]